MRSVLDTRFTSPRCVRLKTTLIAQISTVKMIATTIASCVALAAATPTIIAIKTLTSSLAVAGRLLKRTSANTPETATAKPIWLLTIISTDVTATGSAKSARTKLLLYR